MKLNNTYTSSPFDENLAKAGNPLMVTVSAGSGYDEGNYLVEEFGNNPNPQEISYPYRVLITVERTSGTDVTSTPMYLVFDRSGYNEAYDIDFGLYMANSAIDQGGAEQGDIVYEDYSLTSLNYRETVASRVLPALIEHVDNPLGYTDSTVRLLVKKAFDFAIEFTNQAIELRLANVDPGTGEPTEMTVQEALNVVADKLDDIQSALVDSSGQTPVSYLSNLSDMKKALIDDTTTPDTTVISKLGDIATALGTTGTTLSTIATNTSNTVNRLTVNRQGVDTSAAQLMSETATNTSATADRLKTSVQGYDRSAAEILAAQNTQLSDLRTELKFNGGINPRTSGDMLHYIEEVLYETQHEGGYTTAELLTSIKNNTAHS